MLKLHTYTYIENAIKSIKQLTKERGYPIHAALYASWGTGKTIAAKQIKDLDTDTYYLKFPSRQTEPASLIKDILLSLGVGPTKGYLNNYDLLVKVLSTRGIINPVLVIDEAQIAFTKPNILSFLKDLSEDTDIGFCYVFLGDESLERMVSAEGHSIHKRIKVKAKIPPITEDTINKLTTHYGIKLTEQANLSGITTIDLDFALYLAKKSRKTELTAKELDQFVKAAKRGV